EAGAFAVGATPGLAGGAGCALAGAIAVAGLPGAGAFGFAPGCVEPGCAAPGCMTPGWAAPCCCVALAGAVADCGSGGPFFAPGKVCAPGAPIAFGVVAALG